jgi:hypothetical protein
MQVARDVRHSDSVTIRPLAIIRVAKGRSVFLLEGHFDRWEARHGRTIAGVPHVPLAPTRLLVTGRDEFS